MEGPQAIPPMHWLIFGAAVFIMVAALFNKAIKIMLKLAIFNDSLDKILARFLNDFGNFIVGCLLAMIVGILLNSKVNDSGAEIVDMNMLTDTSRI